MFLGGELKLLCGMFFLCYNRYERVLQHMTADLRADIGPRVVEYIRAIDVKTYSRHAFPLPRMGKVTSNPCEQANSGLLQFRMLAPFKLLVALWVYI